LRLHRLERPAPWPEDLIDKVWLAQQNINFYPDYAPFVHQVAKFVGQPPGRVVIGLGVESLIRDLFLLSCDPKSSVAYTWPTCAMFDVYAAIFDAEPMRIIVPPDGDISTTEIIIQIPEDCRLFLLPNPGQPAESCFSPNEMREIAEHCCKIGCVLAIDEAYYHFGAPTCAELVEEYDNVVILRSFSKALGAAGIRLGVAFGRENVIRPLDAVRLSGEVPGPSMAAASVLMENWKTHIQPGIAEIRAGRNWLYRSLLDSGMKVMGGQRSNHVLLEIPQAEWISGRLAARGAWVKSGFPPPLDRHILITCGPPAMMKEFRLILDEVRS
jgi:histidinol-phosphate aminotransferase